MAVSTFFNIVLSIENWIVNIILLPFILFAIYFVFIFGIAIFTKAFLIIVNLIHTPKEGVFKAEEGDKDYEFWRVRVELKKLAIWLMNQSPLPWIVMWGFRWFGVKLDFSSHLQDAWVDTDFIECGRKVTIGQGAVVMSSMIVGNYLIIKKVIIDDYTVVGGVSNVAPGSIFGKESVIGAFTNVNLNQVIEKGWIYLGLPAKKYKPNRYTEERRDIIYKTDVISETKYEVQQDVNSDEEKNNLLNNNKESA
ncbi:MAG: hypothetical protein KGD68_04795 [Candidatus Lokiarchaeota archaeon]|nr:hypothetical protein [Candidatus Lokiarchaeota archaeon]